MRTQVQSSDMKAKKISLKGTLMITNEADSRAIPYAVSFIHNGA